MDASNGGHQLESCPNSRIAVSKVIYVLSNFHVTLRESDAFIRKFEEYGTTQLQTVKSPNWRWSQKRVCDRNVAEEQFLRGRYIPSRRWVCEQTQKILGDTTGKKIRINPSWNILNKENQLVHRNIVEDGQCSELEDIRKSEPRWSTWGRKSCRAQKFQSSKTSEWNWHGFISLGVLWEIHQYFDGMEGMKV